MKPAMRGAHSTNLRASIRAIPSRACMKEVSREQECQRQTAKRGPRGEQQTAARTARRSNRTHCEHSKHPASKQSRENVRRKRWTHVTGNEEGVSLLGLKVLDPVDHANAVRDGVRCGRRGLSKACKVRVAPITGQAAISSNVRHWKQHQGWNAAQVPSDLGHEARGDTLVRGSAVRVANADGSLDVRHLRAALASDEGDTFAKHAGACRRQKQKHSTSEWSESSKAG